MPGAKNELRNKRKPLMVEIVAAAKTFHGSNPGPIPSQPMSVRIQNAIAAANSTKVMA